MQQAEAVLDGAGARHALRVSGGAKAHNAVAGLIGQAPRADLSGLDETPNRCHLLLDRRALVLLTRLHTRLMGIKAHDHLAWGVLATFSSRQLARILRSDILA